MMKRADRISGMVLMLISVYGFVYSSGLKGDAGVLPRLIFIGMFCGAAVLSAFSFRKVQTELLEKMKWKKWLAAVGGASAYAALINVLGFYLASALYLSATMFYFGVRSKKTLIAVPVIFDLLIFVCFGMILGIRLPAPMFM